MHLSPSTTLRKKLNSLENEILCEHVVRPWHLHDDAPVSQLDGFGLESVPQDHQDGGEAPLVTVSLEQVKQTL